MNRLWSLVHNLVAHPLMEIAFQLGWSWGLEITDRFHDYTADKAWGHLEDDS